MFSTGVEIFGGGTERVDGLADGSGVRAPGTVAHDGDRCAAFDTISSRRLVLKVRPGSGVA